MAKQSNIFTGSLHIKKAPPDIKRLYWVWSEQKGRCSRPQHPRFKKYGAKGIRVEYTSREFIGWGLSNLTKKKNFVGRIDHEKNYSFNNIRPETASESCLEMWSRKRKLKTISLISKGRKFRFESQTTAGRFLKCTSAAISYALLNKTKCKGWEVLSEKT